MSDDKIQIGIVASEFHHDIVMEMINLAQEHAKFLDAEINTIIKVPGVFDMPLAVKKLLEAEDIDAVVTLGAVIEGETEHDEIVIQHTARKITDLSVEYNKPVGLGITGPGMTRMQASTRIDRAKSAVESVVKLHKRLK
ncbi:MAG: 6,7-dimethyl-8-ribityllumazine synthase [Thermoplasmata archaeon]|nr:6,7-dimethyl-8-ribityllumazine synthase [Thermoplasmata archaeon]